MVETQKILRTAAPLRQQVVKLIREQILDETFKPGQRLLENTLCEAYGVSRTVIREALRQLESEHLITMLHSKGPIVTVLTEDEIRAIYVVRANLEGLVGRLFAENADKADVEALIALQERLEPDYRHGTVQSREEIKAEFYVILLAGAKNEILSEVLGAIHARIAVFRRYAFLDAERVALSVDELNGIINAAARKQDPDAAAGACEKHIIGAGELAIMEYEKRTKDVKAQAV